jgi:serine/threonine protein kinase
MSHNFTAEQFAQRIYECRLLEMRQMDEVFASLGGRGVEFEDFKTELLRRELLTNWQTTRLIDGHRRGYYYGNWKILYLVGSGTFARVYRSAHQKTGEMKAVKVLRNRYSNDMEMQERFMREAQTVIKLRHPNIVPIYEVKTDRNRTYMVMDFIEGQNLRDFVRTHGKLNLTYSLNIIRDVANGLKYAAAENVTHRDIKLSNVLLSTNGKANLVDFGLAVIDDKTAGGDEFSPRSVDYAGLEKTTNVKRNDKRSDIFFMGCMLYNMVAGKSPLEETRERMRRMSSQRYREIEPVTNHVADLPHRVVLLISRLMELNVEKRIQTPEQAVREIDSVIAAINAGDDKAYDENLSQQDAAAFAKKTRKSTEGINHTVMVVETHTDVQNLLRDKLKKLGYRVLVLTDPRRAIGRFENLDPAEERPADCVVFGCAGLNRDGLEAFNYFADSPWSKDVPAILLLRENQLEFKKLAHLDDHRVCGSMPIKFRQIREYLQQLLKISEDEGVVDEAENENGKV